MRSQGFASPSGYGGGRTIFPLQQKGALGACRQELVHSSRAVKLYIAVRHASALGTRTSRARVRPRSEHAAASQRRTIPLLPVGTAGAPPSFLETRLASSVMAGDDHMEQLSLLQQRGAAATPTAAMWTHGHGSSSGSLGGEGGRRGKDERQHQQRAQRGGERGRSGRNGVATAAAPATATHQEVRSLSISCLRESSLE